MWFSTYAVLASMLLRQTAALPDTRPLQTIFADLGGNLMGFSPLPTAVPERRDQGFFQKRASAPGPTCGYISGNFYNPITCDATQYCAANTRYGVFGCCNSYSPLPNGDYTFTSCQFRSKCYDSTATGQCTGTCTTDDLVGFCKSRDYPYCQTFSLTDLGLSAYGCNTIPQYTIQARLTATTTFSVPPQTGSASRGLSNGPANSATSTPLGGSGGTSQTQVPAPSGSKSVVGPAVGGAVGGLAVVVIAVGLAFWLRMKHKKQKAATAAAAGGNNPGANGGPGFGTGAAAGAGVGAIAAGGAYAANEYHKPQQDHSNGQIPMGHDTNAPPYPGPPMTQIPPQNQGLQSPVMSEMPSSPTMTNNTYSTGSGYAQQPISEIDGSNSGAPQSPTVSGVGAAHIQRKSVGTNSLLSGSAGDRTELDSTSGQPQQPATTTTTSSSTTGVPGAAASTGPQQQGGPSFQTGPVNDWNRPYHELE